MDAHDDKQVTPTAKVDNEQMYRRIFEAIVDHKLSPGQHLKEDELCDIFGVGRTRIRAVLSRLAADQVVNIVTNRGAFVARPTVEEAREVFRARRLIESHLVRRVAELRDPAIRTALHDHLNKEQEARDGGEQGVVIKRCAKYHQVLADQADSPILAKILRELIARSALIIAVYEQKSPDECEMVEHRDLTRLVLDGKGDEAAELMDRHLRGIEARLDLTTKRSDELDLRSCLL